MASAERGAVCAWAPTRPEPPSSAALPRYVLDESASSAFGGIRQVSFLGTSEIYGALDLADALDLDAALDREAAALAAAGCEASLDTRRAMALGRLARGETAGSSGAGRAGRAVTLYVHLPADTHPDAAAGTAVVENGGHRLLTQAQVAAWCGNPEVRVTIKPVIDLHTVQHADTYVVPDRIKEHVALRDRTCVFPHCTRPARTCQHDHTHAYDQGGATTTENLAALCQHHHNLKTHTHWTYTRIEPDVYLWHSPHGYTFLRDHHGTHDLTPPPAPAPAPGPAAPPDG